MEPQQIVEKLTNLGCLVDRESLNQINKEDIEKIENLEIKPLLINSEFIQNLRKHPLNEFRNKDVHVSERSEFEVIERRKHNLEGKIELQDPYIDKGGKRDIIQFVKLFNDRYERIKNLLMMRRELRSAVSIINVHENNKEVSIIAMVSEKYKTKKDQFILTVEDPTGQIKVYCPAQFGEKIVEDEVIGITGKPGNGIIFAHEILWPEIPIPSEIKRTKDEIYAAFISDLHFGSKQLLTKKINKFLKWINSNHKIAEKVLYIFATGDLVDGVGKYEDQDKNLAQKDIYKQYDSLSKFIENIPENIQIVLIPGDHDIVRMAEPQPQLPQKAVPELYKLSNVHLAPNPCYANAYGLDGSKISVLLYHGYYYHGHVDSLPILRKYATDSPTKVMVDLLRRRHLAPIYGTRSSLISPEDKDYMVIDKIPDIFSMGHLHSFDYSNYKGINLVCASTFQAETDFQRRVGHKPDPGKVALINLKTRDAILKTF